MTILATITNTLSDDVLARMAAYVDEPVDKTTKAANGLIYTVFGGFIKRVTSEIGVNQLFNNIQKGKYDGSLLDNLTTILREPTQANALITQGNDAISHLLPAMKSSIGSMISGYAGIRNSSSISLLGLVTTIVLNVLGKQVQEKKLNADTLATALFGERDTLANAVPDELMPKLIEKLGLRQVMAGVAMPARRSEEIVASPARTTTTATRPPVSYAPSDDSDTNNESLTKWGVGALIALALAFGGYYLYQNTQKYSTATADTSVASDTLSADTVARSLPPPPDSTRKTAPAATSLVAGNPATGVPTAATAGAAVPASNGELTAQLTPYMGNPTLPKGRVFPLKGVVFQPGSLSLTPASQATVNELATVLKTYPKMQVQLVGYANDAVAASGLTNKSLSFKRVNIVKQQLVASGIDFVRIDAIGRGTGVARFDTVGPPKPTLRKIDMKVVIK